MVTTPGGDKLLVAVKDFKAGHVSSKGFRVHAFVNLTEY